MQHVKLARDRRKKRFRIKTVFFLISLTLIFTGLSLNQKESENTAQAPLPALQNDTAYQSLTADTGSAAAQSAVENRQDSASTSPKGENNEDAATSYDDDLQEKDDEAEVATPQHDEFDDLPQEAQSALTDLLEAADQAIRISDQFSYTVTLDDTLKDVLELSGLEDDTAQRLMADYPELNHLVAGQQFYWFLDKNDQLAYLNWLISEKEERIYERQEDGSFKRQILEKKSVWKKEVLKGNVNGSLATSLRSLGLDGRQINQLSSALQWQISLQKLKKEAKFAVLVSREYLGDKLTGQGNVEAIHIMQNNRSYYAIQAANGRYYNKQGETLGKGFSRYPLQRQPRVSSPFNPNRRHPVTKRIRPHKGVDFSVPTGTPIIAPADGTIEKVAYQSGGAGRYIVLRHSREYQTVYMHLSKPLVKAGQAIKKGQRIALSGNTGISTGPHLHYEFHINGRPVNPLTVKLPGSSSGMATVERKQFLLKAKEVEWVLKL